MINLDYLYNPDAARDAFKKDYFLDKKLGFQVIEHGMICPAKTGVVNGKKGHIHDGVFDGKGEFVRGTSTNSNVVPIKSPPPPESIQHSTETVIYLGMFFPVWGHCITDNLCRIWFLKSELFKSDFKNCPLVYVPEESFLASNNTNFKRLLAILGVDFEQIRAITQPTKFEKIILADRAFGANFTNEYRETIEQIRHFALKNRTPTSNKKIYYFNGRKGVGEERIVEYFKSKGYDIVRPETLSFDEQLNLTINCEHFASIGCSAAHNSLFLRDDAEMIFIPRAASRFSNYQEIINKIHPLNINYVDSSLSIFSGGIAAGNHFYLVSEHLKRFFGDKWDGYDDEDFKNFLQYVKDSMINGHVINEKAKKYYSEIFTDFMDQLKQRQDLITACNMPPHWEKFQPPLTYQTHVHSKGWGVWSYENTISNDIDQQLDIQAIKINFPDHKVYYSVYWNDAEGWSKEITNSEMAGTTGKNKPIFGIRIRLDEAGAKEFNILYRVHKFEGTWTDWAKNGEVIYSNGQKLNAIQIKLEDKTKT